MHEQSFGFIPFYKDNELKVFLIHQYGSGGDTLWTFPKGHGEEGESPFETAVRELKEETALQIKKYDSNRTLNSTYSFSRNGQEVNKISTYYVGLVEDKNFVVQPEEVKEAGWFTIDEARGRITFPECKKMLDDAVKILDDL